MILFLNLTNYNSLILYTSLFDRLFCYWCPLLCTSHYLYFLQKILTLSCVNYFKSKRDTIKSWYSILPSDTLVVLNNTLPPNPYFGNNWFIIQYDYKAHYLTHKTFHICNYNRVYVTYWVRLVSMWPSSFLHISCDCGISNLFCMQVIS